MKFGVSSLIRKKKKIFKSIILPVTVYMMNNFSRFNISPKMFLHYKTMLSNVTGIITKRMIRFMNKNILITICKFSTFPIWVFRTRNLDKLLPFIPWDMSFISFAYGIFYFLRTRFTNARNIWFAFFRFTIALIRTIFNTCFKSIRSYKKRFITYCASNFHIQSITRNITNCKEELCQL